MWPIWDLLELMGIFGRWAPKTSRRQVDLYPASPCGVDVAWAFTYCTSCGSSAASAIASRIARTMAGGWGR